MITISVCMIVKNEERILARCLDSLKGLYEELIIVDTGSSDCTKEIALQYTNNVYDFEWNYNFSDARNFAFSKATKDYIYCADADEVLDENNRNQFMMLKKVMDEQVDIVQMYYANQLQYNTVYNYDREYRPKLYKRLRKFYWEDPVHEAVRLDPVIFDSDIEILHMPENCHSKRDFKSYQVVIQKGDKLSKKALSMYARELFVSGEEEDFLEAFPYFESVLKNEIVEEEQLKEMQAVLARARHLQKDDVAFLSVCLCHVADGKANAEICYELGQFYEERLDYDNAYLWYYNAAFETESSLNIHYGGDYPLHKLSECMRSCGNEEEAQKYEQMENDWKQEHAK